MLIGDAQEFDTLAQQISHGQAISQTYYQAQLYPYFLAVVYAVAGHHVFVARVVQAILGSGSCVLLGLAGRRFMGGGAGIAAGVLLAIYPPAIFFDCVIQKSALDGVLMAAMLALLGELYRRPRWQWWLCTGAVLGLFAWNRENARALYPVVAAWLFLEFRQFPMRQRMAWAGALAAGIVLVTIPVAVRNYQLTGEFVLSTSQLGPNFYIGNRSGATGIYESLVPGRGNAVFERADAVAIAENETKRTLSPGQVSTYWLERSLADIRHAPASWATLMGRKILLTFNAEEVADTESLDAYRTESVVLSALRWLTLGVVLPLAAFGVWQTRRQWHHLWILYASFAAMALSVAVFYVMARYRYPLVPIALLFAGSTLAGLPACFRRPPPTWWTGALIAGVVAAIVNLPLHAGKDATLRNVGLELMRQHRSAEAIPLLQQALNAAPGEALLHYNLGMAYGDQADRTRALAEFAEAVRLRPDYVDAQTSLGLALRAAGRTAEALDHFRETVRLKPDAWGAHLNLALALQQIGDRNGAIREFTAALAINPNDGPTHGDLALVLADANDNANALDQFSQAAHLQPANAAAHANLANMLLQLGRTNDAIAEYERATTLSADSADTFYWLAQAYAVAGRYTDALSRLDRALALASASGRADDIARINAAIADCKRRLGR